MATFRNTRDGLRPTALTSAVWLSLAGTAHAGTPQEVVFDADMLSSVNREVDLSRFALGNPVDAGYKRVHVHVNDMPLERRTLRYAVPHGAAPGAAQPCFDDTLLALAGVRPERMQGGPLAEGECRPLHEWLPGARAEHDASTGHLSLWIPQAELVARARGTTDPSTWDAGINAARLNYAFNAYRTHGGEERGDTHAFLQLDAGLNVGQWRWRHRSTQRLQDGVHASDVLSSYVQTDLPQHGAHVTFGDFTTEGALFDSMSIRGARIASESQMLPDSLRGFAPIVRGVARSNALVTIRQDGRVIHEVTVPAGAFEIRDLFPTGHGGDLDVTVTEADGHVETTDPGRTAPETRGLAMRRPNTRQRGRHAVLCPTFLALSLAAALHAGTAAAQTNPLDRLQQREERERQEAEILRALEEQRQREQTTTPKPAPAAPPSVELGGEFLIHRITLDNEPAMAGGSRRAERKRAILAKYEGTTMGSAAMTQLVRELVNDYADEGYVTTTVTLKPQNIKSGDLALQVNWGTVAGWRFKDAEIGALRQGALLASLPRVTGEPLQIGMVDQAVEILNNGMQVAKIDIVPAEETGQSWLEISLQSRAPINGSIGADNSGTHEEVGGGLYRASADVSLRGLGAETWSIGTTQRLFFNGHDDVEDSANIALGIPMGFWTVDLRHSRSRYEKAIHSFFGRYDSWGDSRDDSLKISRAFDRSRRGKSSVFLRINHKDSNNYIEGKRLDVNSKRYTDLSLGLSRVDQLWGGSLYADINLGRGTPWLGANYTKPHVSDETAAMYTKWSGNVSWNRGFKIGRQAFDYAMRTGWQYSTHAMLGANKLTIGDEYTVRGYKGNSVFGDRGMYVSNTLTAPLPGGLSAFVGFDAGAVEDNDVRAVRQAITGAAIGVRMRLPKGGNLAFTSATPLGAERSQESVVYASLQLRF